MAAGSATHSLDVTILKIELSTHLNDDTLLKYTMSLWTFQGCLGWEISF